MGGYNTQKTGQGMNQCVKGVNSTNKNYVKTRDNHYYSYQYLHLISTLDNLGGGSVGKVTAKLANYSFPKVL